MASAARRAASGPMPPQTSTARSFSKKRNRRPSYSFSLTRQCLTRGRTSLSRAATMAISGIAVGPEPVDCAAEGVVDGGDLPAQVAFSFPRAGEHLFLAHAHGVDGGARLAMKQPPGDGFVDNSCQEGKKIRQLECRRR